MDSFPHPTRSSGASWYTYFADAHSPFTTDLRTRALQDVASQENQGSKERVLAQCTPVNAADGPQHSDARRREAQPSQKLNTLASYM